MHDAFYKFATTLMAALFSTYCHAGSCSIFMPAEPGVEVTAKKCSPGSICKLDACEGSISVPSSAKAARVFFRNPFKKSDMAIVGPGRTLDLATLEIGGDITSSIKYLFAALTSTTSQSRSGGRHALGDGGSQGGPSGTIAVPASGDLVFAIKGNGAGQVYQFSASDQGAQQRFTSDGSGLVHIPAHLLTPTQNYRGGFQSATTVSFSIASPQKLSQLRTELGAINEPDEESIQVRKALILLDSGLTWNAQQILDGVDQRL